MRWYRRLIKAMACEDRPLSIGHGQTISQPYMVAAMTAALNPQASDCVLDVGTGSGYQVKSLRGSLCRLAPLLFRGDCAISLPTVGDL